MAIGRVPGATGIQPSIVTAKGDLIVATANGSVTNQAVGTNNQVLMADSAQADGVKWANEATATLTTTGDMLYASAANTLARRAIGSTGDVLTVSGGLPTWAAPVSGSLTLLSTTSLSGATTTISGISGTYTHLFAYVYGMTNATSNGEFYVRPNDLSNVSTGVGSNIDTGGVVTGRGYRSGLLYFNFSNAITRTNSTNGFYLFIYNYANTSAIKPFQVGGSFDSGGVMASQYNGAIGTTSAITSLVFANGGGNLSTGTVLLYGVK